MNDETRCIDSQWDKFSIDVSEPVERSGDSSVKVRKKKNYTVTMQFNSNLAFDGLGIKFLGLSNKEKVTKIKTLIDECMGEEKWLIRKKSHIRKK
ncbi:MAG: hypothetical protein ACUZ8O_14330 [Candidatus Anammoxibacter sp.]